MYIADPQQPPTDVFMYMLTPTRPAMLTEGATPEERAAAGRHWMYSIDLLKKGIIFFADLIKRNGNWIVDGWVPRASTPIPNTQ